MTQICRNCLDYDSSKRECKIRTTTTRHKKVIQLKRKPTQKACQVFMYKFTM